MKRRDFLLLGGGAAALVSLGGLRARSLPLPVSGAPAGTSSPLGGLATSIAEEHDYRPRVHGVLPAGLRGTLYRNGPGLFERGGERKRNLLDGDGLIQAFDFGPGGQVRFRARFVRTEKFRAEEEAGRFVYATWTTQAPGGALANLFGRSMGNQAGVTVVARNGRLLAFDESAHPYELDAETLETIGPTDLGAGAHVRFAAHSKVDARTGDWLHFGLEYGRSLTLHLTTFDARGVVRRHRALPLPRYVYLHDFFVTARHVVLNLHPAPISILPFILGQRSLKDSISWRPGEGNLLMIVDRDGGGTPRLIEANAAWMWHAINAWEAGREIVADFIGYDAPAHFLGEDAVFSAVMRGEPGTWGPPGEVRRYVIDLEAGRARQEVVSTGRHEYPFVDPREACHRHRLAWVAKARPGDAYFTAVAGIDARTGRTDGFQFDDGQYCGEPVVATGPGEEPGWLLTEVWDAKTDTTRLAILDAAHLAAGPMATVELTHALPISLHGCWWAA